MEEGEIITDKSANPSIISNDDDSELTESNVEEKLESGDQSLEPVEAGLPNKNSETNEKDNVNISSETNVDTVKTEPDFVAKLNENLSEIKDEPSRSLEQDISDVKDEIKSDNDNQTSKMTYDTDQTSKPIDNTIKVESDGQNLDGAVMVKDTTETEEGELDDSNDEKDNVPDDLTTNNNIAINETARTNIESKPENTSAGDGIKRSESVNDDPRGYGIDDNRPDDLEQLDYDEDDTDIRIKNTDLSTDAFRVIDRAVKERSDGEVDSDSDGELKSDGEDFEEGETRDGPQDVPQEQKRPCRFFLMGNCTWGDRCRYLHPGVNDRGNYNMFSDNERNRQTQRDIPEFHQQPQGYRSPWENEPPPFMPPPVAETAWEKGLRHAKELKKRALQRKVQEPDFVQKREVLSLNLALNEDRDMEFVDHKPLGPANKGFDPFQEIEADEYAVPTPEEMRRQARMHRERQRGGPPPPIRHPPGKDHRLPPPEHLLHPKSHERRPPSPHRLPPPGHYPPDMRRMSPHQPIYGKDRHPKDSGFIHRVDEQRDGNRDRRPDKDMQRPDQHLPLHDDRREAPRDQTKDEKFQIDEFKLAENGAPNVRSDQWVDPWARARPQARGRNKNKDSSSSSSGSSSGSSSRSSSHSSYSSRSSSGSSRSSSRSSGSSHSSSYSSHSSRSPAPSKGVKSKKKILASAKQRNAAVGAQKKAPQIVGKNTTGTKPVTQIKSSKDKQIIPQAKAPPDVAKNFSNAANNASLPVPTNLTIKPIVAKKDKALPKKQRKSSSSSEFSRSDSSASPSPSRGKNKSGSGSDSGSSGSSSSSYTSSSGSSSSDSDGDKTKSKKSAKSTGSAGGNKPPTVPKVAAQKGKVAVPSKPGRKDVKMTIIDKPGIAKDRKRPASELSGQTKKPPSNRRVELLEQLRAVEDAIARKRAKLN
ncbi:uncharacterized protein LOC120346921 [Styela clava]